MKGPEERVLEKAFEKELQDAIKRLEAMKMPRGFVEVSERMAVNGFIAGLCKGVELLGTGAHACPKCARISHNPEDKANKFCGVCGWIER